MRKDPVVIDPLSSSIFTCDLDFGDKFIITLARNLTLDCKNVRNGESYTIIIKQDEFGNRLLSFSENIIGQKSINLSPKGVTVMEFSGMDNKLYLQSGGSAGGGSTPSLGQYSYFVDPDSGLQVRIGAKSNGLTIDRELTTTGFNGEEGTDWENIGGNN